MYTEYARLCSKKNWREFTNALNQCYRGCAAYNFYKKSKIFYSHPETTLPEFSLGMTVSLTVWWGIVYVLLITITKALLQFWSIVLKMFVRTLFYGSCLLSSINTLSHTITCRTIICRGEVTWGKTPENAESMCDFVSLPDKYQLSLIHLLILPDKV